MSDFHVGQQVICVDDKKGDKYNPVLIPHWVKKDAEYIIRGFADNDGIVVGIWLEEIVNPPIPIQLLNRFQEPAFATWRFRAGKSAFTLKEEKEAAKNKEVIVTDGEDEVESVKRMI